MAWNLQKSSAARVRTAGFQARRAAGIRGSPHDGRRSCHRVSAIDVARTKKLRSRHFNKGIVMKSSLLLILLAAAGLASPAWAGPIYKCAGPTGATVFSQT